MTFDRIFFKEYFLKPLCFSAVIVIVLFILNQFTFFNISLGSNNNYNSFEVVGEGNVEAVPNVAQTTYSIERKASTQEAAKDAANEIQNKALAGLISLGIKKEDIKTINFSVNPNYEPIDVQPLIYPPSRSTQQGYVANISVLVKSSDVEKINQAIDKLTELGANVGGVDYTYSDKATYLKEAQDKAVLDAKAQAQNLAKAAGFKLGKVLSIRNADQDPVNPVDQYSLKSAAPEASGGDTNLQPGSSKITSRIGVTFQIKN